MKKTMLTVSLMALSAALLAETVPVAAVTNAVSAPGRTKRSKLNPARFTGGRVRKANSASGKFVFLNAQKLVPAASIAPAYAMVEKQIRPTWEAKDVENVSLVNPKADIRLANGNLGVAIVDAPEMPALVTAPEDGWAIVNVRALAAGNPTAEVLAARTRKEVLRAFALVSGCTFMARGQVVMRDDIRVPGDLDIIKDESYGVDALAAMERKMPLYGVTPWYETTYRKACEEGWAPAPTNEFQKAIWDKVHAMPAEPIKIAPETKKVTE